ncbi:MAG: hypothetical protein Q4B17_08805 [Lautropia sp.]|nr:hypothetical protein [Lautropia sp.]
MNEPSPSTADQAESAEEIFARIQRRRGMLDATDARILPTGKSGADALAVTEGPTPADDAERPAAPGHGDTNGRDDAGPHPDTDQDPIETMRNRHHRNARSPLPDDTHELVPFRMSESVWDDDGDYIDMDPGFPRSRTFRTLCRHPELALAVALPVAYLALRSAVIRRTAFQVGKFAVKQQMWKQVRRFTG